MPICITCSTPVKHLYTTYSKADDRSLGKGVRLTQCPNCKRFADKYVEHDFVVLFIDLVLIKPQVYRHLLFNRLTRSDDRLDPSIFRLGTLLILFDVYLTWTRIEKSAPGNGERSPANSLTEAPIIVQYLFFLTMNVVATFAHHLAVRLLVQLFILKPMQGSPIPSSTQFGPSSPDREDMQHGINGHTTAFDDHLHDRTRTDGPGYASPSAISTALLVSSCTKLFPILLVIWPTQSSEGNGTSPPSQSFAARARSYVGWAVLLNNIEALLILLDCGYVAATGLALAGSASRWLVESVILGAVGLDGDGAPVGDMLGIIGKLGGWFSRR